MTALFIWCPCSIQINLDLFLYRPLIERYRGFNRSCRNFPTYILDLFCSNGYTEIKRFHNYINEQEFNMKVISVLENYESYYFQLFLTLN